MHYMYSRENVNGRTALRMHHAQFPDLRMLDHRIFQLLHRQLNETGSIHVAGYEDGRQIAVLSPSLVECILNIVIDKPKSSTKVVIHQR